MSEDVLLRQLLGPFKEYRQAQTKEDETRTMVMLWKIVWFMSRLNTNISNHKNAKRRKLTQKSASLYQTSRTIASRDNKFERRSRGSFAKLMFQKYLLFPSAVSRRLWNINRPNLWKKDFQILLILRVMRMIMWSSATYKNISTVVKRQRKLVMLW